MDKRAIAALTAALPYVRQARNDAKAQHDMEGDVCQYEIVQEIEAITDEIKYILSAS